MEPGELVAMDANTLSPELRDKVFKNELIRDRIFDYVFTFDAIRTSGLVEHSWLNYVTDRLQKTKKSPLEHLSFSLWGMSNEAQERVPQHFQVQKFLFTWATFPGAGSRVPLFSLNFERDYIACIKRNKVQDLIKCLMRCGCGLHSMYIDLLGTTDDKLNDALIRKDFDDDLSQLDLPRLKRLSLIVCPADKDNRLFTLLLPPIFLGCRQLKHIILHDEFSNKVPVSRFVSKDGKIEYLPETLEKIEIDALMTSQLLSTLLLKNSFPNLTELRLKICKEAFSQGVISKILHRFSRQLKSFVGNYSEVLRNHSTFIKFPVMTKLKEMSIISFHSDLEPGMEQPFPVLETLKLKRQSSKIMRKWTQNFHFSCVTDLNVEFDEIENAEWSQEVHVSFPHLQNLRLSVSSRVQAGCIQNIFQHLTQLRELSIELKLKHTEDISGASTWDAILLGVSPEYAKYLAQCPRELWNSINLSHIRSPSHSIVNLSNMTTFLLEVDEVYHDMNDPFISDVSFHFAFLRMPNLHHLTLDSGFGASAQMVEEWNRRGRNFYGYRIVSEDEQDVKGPQPPCHCMALTAQLIN